MFGRGDDADGIKDGDEPPYRADFFHLVFALASMYLAMLVSADCVTRCFESHQSV